MPVGTWLVQFWCVCACPDWMVNGSPYRQALNCCPKTLWRVLLSLECASSLEAFQELVVNGARLATTLTAELGLEADQ